MTLKISIWIFDTNYDYQLWLLFTDDGQFKHWETIKSAEEEKNPWSKNPRPIGIEASSYALLTYSQRNYVGKLVVRITHYN